MTDSFVFMPVADCDTIICCFTSFGLPNEPASGFEWFKIFENDNIHAFHCLDARQSWYLQGVEGLAETPEGVAEAIRAYAEERAIKRVVTIGSSMGGYGALLIGGLIGADLSIAMSPQSRTGAPWSIINGDERWLHRYKVMEEENVLERDLAVEFYGGRRPKEAVIIVDSSNSLDAMHAIRLSDYSRLIDLRGSGHNVARNALKSGLLNQLIGI